MQEYRELWGIEGTVLLDETGEYARLLGVQGVPTNVVVDSGGIVRAFGASNPDVLHAAIEDLIHDGSTELLA